MHGFDLSSRDVYSGGRWLLGRRVCGPNTIHGCTLSIVKRGTVLAATAGEVELGILVDDLPAMATATAGDAGSAPLLAPTPTKWCLCIATGTGPHAGVSKVSVLGYRDLSVAGAPVVPQFVPKPKPPPVANPAAAVPGRPDEAHCAPRQPPPTTAAARRLPTDAATQLAGPPAAGATTRAPPSGEAGYQVKMRRAGNQMSFGIFLTDMAGRVQVSGAKAGSPAFAALGVTGQGRALLKIDGAVVASKVHAIKLLRREREVVLLLGLATGASGSMGTSNVR